MANNYEIAVAFANKKKKLKAANMYIEDYVVYSYGSHFPIAKWIGDNAVLFNKDGYSNTTAHQKGKVFDVINRGNFEIIYCNTKSLRDAIDNPGRPVIIYEKEKPKDLSSALRPLVEYLRSQNVKVNTSALLCKYKKAISDQLDWDRQRFIGEVDVKPYSKSDWKLTYYIFKYKSKKGFFFSYDRRGASGTNSFLKYMKGEGKIENIKIEKEEMRKKLEAYLFALNL